MTHNGLVIGIDGGGWRISLSVSPPQDSEGRPREFGVIRPGMNGQRRDLVRAQVWYARAHNSLDGWDTWHVKIYQCSTQGDVDSLSAHLVEQSGALEHLNNRLPDASGISIQPPWAIVPVVVVRGDGQNSKTRMWTGTSHTHTHHPTSSSASPQKLPSWCGDHPDQPELYLFAVSPWVDQVPWQSHGDPSIPRVEQLRSFLPLAKGIDALHGLDWIHSDIKPDNICRYFSGKYSGYILIDTDAATRIDPPPQSIRFTPPYDYKALHTRRIPSPEGGYVYDPLVLRAHDRFGFALVLLCALAGHTWVESALLHGDMGDPSGGRIIDDPDRLRTTLRQRWQDHRWDPFINVLIEPFSGRSIESSSAWLEQWLGRLLATANPSTSTKPGETLPKPGPVRKYRGLLDDIRTRALSQPTPKSDRVEETYKALEHKAAVIAADTARQWRWGFTLGIVGLTLWILIGAFGMGK